MDITTINYASQSLKTGATVSHLKANEGTDLPFEKAIKAYCDETGQNPSDVKNNLLQKLSNVSKDISWQSYKFSSQEIGALVSANEIKIGIPSQTVGYQPYGRVQYSDDKSAATIKDYGRVVYRKELADTFHGQVWKDTRKQ